MRIQRRTLTETVAPVIVTTPDGETMTVELTETRPGLFEGAYDGPEIGLYRLSDGTLNSVIGLGPSAPKEFEQTIASGETLLSVIETVRGGNLALEDGIPGVRNVRAGRPASGRGWIGLTPRGAYETVDVRQMSLLPPWLVLLLAAGAIIAGWLLEGRRGKA